MGDCACDVSVAQFSPAAPLSTVYLELTPACNNTCPGCSNVFAHRVRASGHVPGGMGPRLRASGALPPAAALHRRRTNASPGIRTDHRAGAGDGVHVQRFHQCALAGAGKHCTVSVGLSGLECILVSLHGAHAGSHEAFTATPGAFRGNRRHIRQAVARGPGKHQHGDYPPEPRRGAGDYRLEPDIRRGAGSVQSLHRRVLTGGRGQGGAFKRQSRRLSTRATTAVRAA